MRSVQIAASTQLKSGGFRLWMSAPCLAASGTDGACPCRSSFILHPPSCLPSLRPVFASRPFSRFRGDGIMKALTPAPPAHARAGLSAYSALPSGHPAPNHVVRPHIAFFSHLSVSGCLGFAIHEQARRALPPNQVRYPTGCPFAFSCSPPRIAAAQSLSTSQAVTARGGDFHPADKASSRTHSSRKGEASSGIVTD